MKLDNNQEINFDKLKIIQDQFDNSMKFLEKNIAESITNKLKLETLKKDLFEAVKSLLKLKHTWKI